MRYRKTIKIAKGIKLNISNSGISTTIGVPGMSVNFAKRGTYLNTGIPGTGLSHRQKIGGSKRNTSRRSTVTISGKVDLGFDRNGKMVFVQNGRQITDPAVIRKIKQQPGYAKEAERIKQLYIEEQNDKAVEINEDNYDMINIGTLACTVNGYDDFVKIKEHLKVETYTPEKYTVEAPSDTDIRNILEQEAKDKINSWMFWKVDSDRQKYVEEHFDDRKFLMINEWKGNKADFEAKELTKKKAFDEKAKKDYEDTLHRFDLVLEGNEEYIEQSLLDILEDTQLPFEVGVDYDLVSNEVLCVDMLLPSIDDLPNEKAVVMASGAIKMKPKTQKELKEDYVKCVFGIAVVFMASFFNITPSLKNILLSAYTFRRSNDGEMQDDYLYSIIFNRADVEGLDFKELDSYDLCMTQQNRSNLLKSGLLKAIKPYDKEDIL